MAVNESREITIEATPEEILEVLFDIESLPEWSPAHQEVEVLERDADGHPKRTRQVVKIVGISDEQELAHVVHPDGVGWTLVSSQQQRSQEARYTLTAVGEDSTHVRFDITVDPTVPLPSFLIKRGAKGLLDTATEGLRDRVRKVKRG
ncbi:SRPBCC family protein [Mycobacterium sp. NPDC006124]|uniref:SRPBCC family protein n=1 Tax=Mycobacterium sp. NPDC006124 TaxID=3156729 RepID=UPI0033B63CAE